MAAREILVFMLSVACSIHLSVGGSYLVEPVDTNSARGATTRFLCTVNIDLSVGEEVYWHFEPNGDNPEDVATIGPFTNKNPTAFPRYEITGDSLNLNGIYNLEISNTEMRDEGTYSCLIVKGSMTSMSPAQLIVSDTVVTPTSPATCIEDGVASGAELDLMDVHTEGDVVKISCRITGGVPLPILQIVRERETSSSYEVIPSSTSLAGNVTTESATFVISHIDHNARFRCITLHPDKTEYSMGSCGFTRSPEVMFRPVVSIYPPDVYIDGDDDNHVVTLICDVNANPQVQDPVTWSYERNKLTTGNENGAELTFTGVYESYVGESITCTAMNIIGSGSASINFQKTDDLLPFETYILFIIIAGGCLLLFIFTCLIIVCCCQKNDGVYDEEEKNLGYQVNESRPTSVRQDMTHNNDDIIDGFDADNMEVDNFSGGSETDLVREESHKSRASQRSAAMSGADNRSSVRSNEYNEFGNQAYSPDGSTGNNDVEFNTPLY